MSFSSSLRIKSKASRDLAEKAGRRRSAMQTAAKRVSLTMEREIRQAFSSPPGTGSDLFGPGGGQPGLAARTGHTRASIRSAVVSINGGRGFESVVGTPVRWVPIHEYGGTVRGKPLLAIPTVYARKFSTIVRGHAVRGTSANRGAQLYKTAIFKSRGGSLFVWAIQNRGGKRVFPLFLLVPSVTIPARAPFRKTMLRITPELNRIVSEVLGV